MNTLIQYLQEESNRLWREGEAVCEQQWQIMQETTSQEIKEGASLLWEDGLKMLKHSNGLLNLVSMYRVHERSYWYHFDKKYGFR